MEGLLLDNLTQIASLVSGSDLKNLRTANRLWRDVIKIAPVSLRPRNTICIDGLREVARDFPCAASLDLAACPQLKNRDLAHLSQLFPCLAALSLRGLTIDQSPVAQLASLRSLSLQQCLCFSMMECICNMRSLRHLALMDCRMASLPEGLRALSLLETLSLISCPRLAGISDAILANLKHLKVLDLTNCTLLTGLPDSIGGLLQLEVLRLSGCSSLIGLPESIGDLSQLKVMPLTTLNARR